jgi:precorrin-2 dehydrogenase/sirohydrochlorin ferrochelatase
MLRPYFLFPGMSDYPVIFQIQDQLCVVVGAGPVGLRKVRGLLAAGARVRLITSALPARDLQEVQLVLRPYRRGDLAGARLVFAATDDPVLNAAIAADAHAAGIPVNCADDPEHGDFTLPAVLRRGELTVAVSTGGGSPALAATLRDRLEDLLGPEWALVVELAAGLRRLWLTLPTDSEYNRQVLRRLIDRGLPQRMAAGDTAGADRLLAEVVGTGISLKTLGIRLPKGEP